MPTILRVDAYRFYFYSNEPLRPNVHCQRENKICKWWLEKDGCPHVSLKDAGEFSPKELNDIEKIVTEYLFFLLTNWYSFFHLAMPTYEDCQ